MLLVLSGCTGAGPGTDDANPVPDDTGGAPDLTHEPEVCAAPEVTMVAEGDGYLATTAHYTLHIVGFDATESEDLAALAETAWLGFAAFFGVEAAGGPGATAAAAAAAGCCCCCSSWGAGRDAVDAGVALVVSWPGFALLRNGSWPPGCCHGHCGAAAGAAAGSSTSAGNAPDTRTRSRRAASSPSDRPVTLRAAGGGGRAAEMRSRQRGHAARRGGRGGGARRLRCSCHSLLGTPTSRCTSGPACPRPPLA